MPLNNTSAASFTGRSTDDKLPHDASVFVGSLPSNIDQGDLTRMLMEHLSEHTQIKNIKVVRDSKGGVCAFVQCENAMSANALIQTLHASVPKPFLGRILRYEPARAFRSLMISYRTPTQFIASPGASMNIPAPICGEVELDLPYAMRVWKQRNSRFHSILYNSEAVQSEENQNHMAGVSLLDSVLFIHPLKFDEETLNRLVSYFGPLEKFGSVDCTKIDDTNTNAATSIKAANSYPEPHRAPRSFSMDPSCWEIKWEHRDDCVSALMTLKRVPHLSVTWAHQPVPLDQTSRSSHHQNFIPSPWSLHHRSSLSHSSVPDSLSTSPTFKQSVDGGESIASSIDHIIGDDRTENSTSKEGCAEGPNAPIAKDNELSPNHPKLLPQPPSGAREDPSEVISDCKTQLTSSGHRYDLSESTETFGDFNRFSESGAQDLYIPQTPTLDSSTITPLTPGSHFPPTPTSSGAEIPRGVLHKGLETPMSLKGSQSIREIDPNSLFVGGLEMFGPGAWDEEKVRTFFSRFGGLESVKLVRPLNACAAFAFVKFNNAEAPARAVFEEHNRVYEGRTIRVQLRDCNPPKNNWRYGRGRGRPHQHHFVAPRRLNYRPSFSIEDAQIPLHISNEDRAAFRHSQAATEIQLSSLADALAAIDKTPNDDVPSTPDPVNPSSSPMEKLSTASETPAAEKYREWYDNPEFPTRTPEPSSLASSASTTSLPFPASPYAYSVPNGPYLPPPPWMHSYSPHGPYQMPYYPGYPVYPSTAPHQLHSTLTTPPGSDVGNPSTPVQPHWPSVGMYASYIPYPSIASQGQLPPPHMNTQAPVVPTGFIQNEQGTLIAVYQPEVLDQYLAGSRQPPASIAHYPSSNQLPEVGNMPVTPFTPTLNRFKGPPSQQFSVPKRENRRPFHATLSPFPHRQGVDRRENHHGLGSVRQPRSFGGGHSNRGQIHHSAQLHAGLGYQAAQPDIPGDWTGWNHPR